MIKTNTDDRMQRYARLAVRVGVNVQPGQDLLIFAPVENAPLVHALTEAAYESGARHVTEAWWDEYLLRIRYERAALESMEAVNDWMFAAMAQQLERGDAVLVLSNPDPDVALGIDPEKVGRYRSSLAKALKPWRDQRGIRASNCSLITAPTAGWAARVLPETPPQERIDRLWELIYEVCRVNTPDPVSAWEEHTHILAERKERLNRKRYQELLLRAPGTDLRVGLPAGHVWAGGTSTTRTGIDFVANMPTEEVFTLPHRERIDGVLQATKPLNYLGSYIDKFSLTFEKGRIVDFSAEVGEQHLANILKADEGSNRMGEFALVPHSSPISRSGRVFHNIIFDENASCHMAIGSAYRFSLQGSQEMGMEQFLAAGGNVSSVHADLMIGSGELDVDGVTPDGMTEALMRAGEFVFED